MGPSAYTGFRRGSQTLVKFLWASKTLALSKTQERSLKPASHRIWGEMIRYMGTPCHPVVGGLYWTLCAIMLLVPLTNLSPVPYSMLSVGSSVSRLERDDTEHRFVSSLGHVVLIEDLGPQVEIREKIDLLVFTESVFLQKASLAFCVIVNVAFPVRHGRCSEDLWYSLAAFGV